MAHRGTDKAEAMADKKADDAMAAEAITEAAEEHDEAIKKI